MSTVSVRAPEPADATRFAGTTRPAGGAGPRRGTGLFRAFRRWHFYASALVIPILLMLAVTGLIYLFRWQIDPQMHPGVLTVDAPAHGAPLPVSAQQAAVTAACWAIVTALTGYYLFLRGRGARLERVGHSA